MLQMHTQWKCEIIDKIHLKKGLEKCLDIVKISPMNEISAMNSFNCRTLHCYTFLFYWTQKQLVACWKIRGKDHVAAIGLQRIEQLCFDVFKNEGKITLKHWTRFNGKLFWLLVGSCNIQTIYQSLIVVELCANFSLA